MKKLLYLADLSLPNKSAYAIHVLKMCDAFAKNNKVYLILNSNQCSFKKIQKDYNIKNKFYILPLSKKKRKNFFYKLLNLLKTIRLIKDNNFDFIISRNILLSILLTHFKIKNTIEIHTELSGFTKTIFKYTSVENKQKYLNYIFIHKYLNNFFKYKKKYIILDDAIDLDDFKNIKTKEVKNKFIYTGSYIEGKGVRFIIELAKNLKKYKFFLYGNINSFPKKLYVESRKVKNLYINDHVPYNKIPSILKSAQFLLMPYPKKAGVLIKNIFVNKYISPLKMFEYLASRKVIIASKNSSYSHILKNNYNCLLIEPENKKKWLKSILQIIKDPNRQKNLRKNSYKTVKKYTWINRSKEILNFINEK